MRKTFLGTLFTLSAVCALGVFGSAAYGNDHGKEEKENQYEHHQGLVQDWSGHHVVYSRIGPRDGLVAVQHDVRALDSWADSMRRDRHRWHFGERPRPTTTTTSNRDWSISLGGGGVAQDMYPAKYTFDPNATPSCSTDYIVYPVNVTGSATQPNIVGFDNLYSGTTGGAGVCNRTPSGADDGVSATTLWSYYVNAIAGAVATSPALSLDGTKIAFVETAAGVPAHFHVLAWKTGDGRNAANLQSVIAPVVLTSFSANSPAAGSGAATDLTLGSTAADTDTNSSPFINYATDEAYIGNDNGTVFRVTHVFCTQDPACSGGTPPAPSLDATWGTAGALSVCAGKKLTGVVIDGGTGNIFVGCADGRLYGYTSAGAPLPNSPVTAGDGTATGGIVDSPMIDAVNGFAYVSAGSSGGGTSVVVQAKTTDLSSARTATLGSGGHFSLHAPAFNSAYFSSALSTDWVLYEYALDAGDTTDELYGITFAAGHVMNTGTPANLLSSTPATAVEFSPLAAFLNGATDQIFGSSITALTPNFFAFPINTFPANFVAFVLVSQGNGTGGIVVDNASGETQASSVYFGTLGANTAVKLTQAALN